MRTNGFASGTWKRDPTTEELVQPPREGSPRLVKLGSCFLIGRHQGLMMRSRFVCFSFLQRLVPQPVVGDHVDRKRRLALGKFDLGLLPAQSVSRLSGCGYGDRERAVQTVLA